MTGKNTYPASYEDMIKITDKPVVAIDNESFFTYVSAVFEEYYGWSAKDLIGKSVTTIMPDHMKNMHMIGFSRFLTTEQPRLLGKPVKVELVCKNKSILEVELYILGSKIKNNWHFSALINPTEKN
jgi:PAS domain S-box-containing protein